ncbi:hypothetical protein NC653_013550 [Populus alba x Populus x berolinensis]|uniref:Uncharacterized protein n=1 Tax=Populus alba x Populus x berolinensis TaxID=444605 RepID=A0AAD6QUV9_9ROSI|nr:hypothetical protein NC653_013550 [Populus alba x Populus x berolinensis]
MTLNPVTRSHFNNHKGKTTPPASARLPFLFFFRVSTGSNPKSPTVDCSRLMINGEGVCASGSLKAIRVKHVALIKAMKGSGRPRTLINSRNLPSCYKGFTCK